jgi:hypothetical protein
VMYYASQLNAQDDYDGIFNSDGNFDDDDG